jgi:hypothetical protein
MVFCRHVDESQTPLDTFDDRLAVHRRHSEGKEPTRCDGVCSFIVSTCFGHQYANISRGVVDAD